MNLVFFVLLVGTSYPDSAQVYELLQKAATSVGMDARQSLAYADSALRLARRNQDLFAVAEARFHIGTSLFWLGHYSDARDSLIVARTEFESLDSTDGIVKCWRNIGLTYWRSGQYVEAMNCYQRGLDVLERRDNPTLRAGLLNNMGLIYELQGDYPSALDCYLKSLEISEHEGLDNYITITQMNIGAIYNYKGDLDNALRYHQMALARIELSNEKRNLRFCLTHIGSVYRDKKMPALALATFERALAASRQADEPDGIIICLNLAAGVQIDLERNRDAEQRLEEALRLAVQTGLREEEITSRRLLAKIREKSGDWRRAAASLDTCLALAGSIGLRRETFESASQLTALYTSKGRYREALDAYRIAMAAKDSLINEAKLKELARLEFRQAMNVKERENELLRKNMALQQLELDRELLYTRALIIAMIMLSVIASVVAYALVQKRKSHRQLDAMNQVISDQNKQLKQLNEKKNEFLGIVAHDLRNPISAIGSVVELLELPGEIAEPERSEMFAELKRTTRRLRQMVEDLLDVSAIESGKISIDMQPVDLENLTLSILRLQKIIADKKHIVVGLRPPQGHPVVLGDPNRVAEVIDNLVGNAIKYTHPGGSVEVRFEEADHRWIIHVQDSGQGLYPEELAHVFDRSRPLSSKPTGGELSTGLGLIVVKKIVELHGGEIWVTSEKNKGSCFSFSLTSA
jgi:signal transduction histidine kinase